MTQIEEAIVVDLEVISRLLARYKEFEKIHLSRESLVKPQVEEALIRLYADILRFLAKAVSHFSTPSLGKLEKFPIVAMLH